MSVGASVVVISIALAYCRTWGGEVGHNQTWDGCCGGFALQLALCDESSPNPVFNYSVVLILAN